MGRGLLAAPVPRGPARARLAAAGHPAPAPPERCGPAPLSTARQRTTGRGNPRLGVWAADGGPSAAAAGDQVSQSDDTAVAAMPMQQSTDARVHDERTVSTSRVH